MKEFEEYKQYKEDWLKEFTDETIKPFIEKNKYDDFGKEMVKAVVLGADAGSDMCFNFMQLIIGEVYMKLNNEKAKVKTHAEQMTNAACTVSKQQAIIDTLKEAFDSAKKYIDEVPCDPDIYPEQLEAWHNYINALVDVDKMLNKGEKNG